MSTGNGHLDLDALADALDDDAIDDDATGGDAHLAGCAQCREALDDLRSATARVCADLAALPAAALPGDVANRLERSLRAEGTAGTAIVTTLPPRSDRGMRWLPAAAALVLLLGGAGYGLSQLGGSGSDSNTALGGSGDTRGSAGGLELARNSTGTDYDGRASLARAVPGLLGGTSAAQQEKAATSSDDGAATLSAPGSGAPPADARALGDPLARLRTDAGLAECLVALLPPDDPSVLPLALDYASFRGAPAMVVVLPSTLAGKLDVFVVGPACSRANDSTLFYTSVDKP